MKTKLLILFMGLSVLFVGCKKDKAPEDKLADSKKQIIGTWEIQSTTVTYYDASGKVINTENQEYNKGYKYQLDGTMISLLGSEGDSYAYNITNVGNDIMLNIRNNTVKLAFSNSVTMTWTSEEQGGGNLSYAKAITVIQLTKK
ncbi:hypothetical protein IDJ75_20205 [Mucilaginibacter rigui]|uniref:Lipocalin-like domain-containing protein n=1 Tax=Mucilaginibacter rigui TaxID=534635 RepID=A0ABR7XAN2_9SPHI|nr:hypothetical protein [Mucilaginibacter rigui]MBD1387619.1 hypothetical protein [Mucilaginibacter rigui]